MTPAKGRLAIPQVSGTTSGYSQKNGLDRSARAGSKNRASSTAPEPARFPKLARPRRAGSTGSSWLGPGETDRHRASSIPRGPAQKIEPARPDRVSPIPRLWKGKVLERLTRPDRRSQVIRELPSPGWTLVKLPIPEISRRPSSPPLGTALVLVRCWIAPAPSVLRARAKKSLLFSWHTPHLLALIRTSSLGSHTQLISWQPLRLAPAHQRPASSQRACRRMIR